MSTSRIPALVDGYPSHHKNNNMLELPWFYAINLPVVMRQHKVVKLNSLAIVVDEDRYCNKIWLKNSKKYFREDFNVSFETTVKFDAKYLDWGYKNNLTQKILSQNVQYLVKQYANNSHSNSRSFYYSPIPTNNNRIRELDDASMPLCKRQKISRNRNVAFQETEICSYCKQIVNYYETFRCGTCKESYYCSKICQTNHWSEHRLICNGICNGMHNVTSITPIITQNTNTNNTNNTNNDNDNDNDIKTDDIDIDIDDGNIMKIPKKKTIKKGVKEWNFYEIIYWLNRVDGERLSDIKYVNLRKVIFDGKFKGSELSLITDTALRFNGIHDYNERLIILGLIEDLVMNDNFDNIAANTMITDNVETCYVDPISYEIMDDPVLLTVSGNTYNRKTIQQYIEKYKKDPISLQIAQLNDIVPNKNLKDSIDIWIKQHSV